MGDGEEVGCCVALQAWVEELSGAINYPVAVAVCCWWRMPMEFSPLGEYKTQKLEKTKKVGSEEKSEMRSIIKQISRDSTLQIFLARITNRDCNIPLSGLGIFLKICY